MLIKSFADSAGVCQLKQARELASPGPSFLCIAAVFMHVSMHFSLFVSVHC